LTRIIRHAAATLQNLIPLLIILLAFTKFGGEREDGTLRQLIPPDLATAATDRLPL
jgi:hypothetical protein